jgi:hypothetical protein
MNDITSVSCSCQAVSNYVLFQMFMQLPKLILVRTPIFYVRQNKILAICHMNSCRTIDSTRKVATVLFKPDQHGLQGNLVKKGNPKTQNSQLRIEVWSLFYLNHGEPTNWSGIDLHQFCMEVWMLERPEAGCVHNSTHIRWPCRYSDTACLPW